MKKIPVKRKCSFCKGKGEVQLPMKGGVGKTDEWVKCQVCGGLGFRVTMRKVRRL